MAKYNDIVKHIEEQIQNNSIKFGQKMPTIRELSEKFQCSKVTAVRAYEELQKNHIVYSVPQSGYYLVEKSMLSKDNNKKIFDFSSAAPDESVLPYEEFQHCLNQAINIYKHSLFNYSNPRGLNSLIDVLVKHFKEYQVFCKSENIFITTGSQQAINILSIMPFPNGKSNVLIEQPTYNGAIRLLELNNINTLGVERDFNGMDFNELERKFANGNIKFFYTIPRFHNPLGVSYSNDDKKKILKLAEKYDVYIIEDDYLGDLEIKNNNYPMYYYDVSDRVIYVKSFSKILLPGLRVGAVVVPTILKNTFMEYKKWSDLGTSILSQGALEIYIKSGMFNAHGEKIRKIYEERMLALKKVAEINNKQNIKWHIPYTGFFACIEFMDKVNLKKAINNLNQKNILIGDINKSYLKSFEKDNLIRISVSKTSKDNMEYGIKTILSEILT